VADDDVAARSSRTTDGPQAATTNRFRRCARRTGKSGVVNWASVVSVDGGGNATLTVPAFSAAAIYAGATVTGTGPPPVTTVSVTFNEAADTFFGQNIFVTGSIAELSNWNTGSAVPLAWISGNGTRGNWRATQTLPASTRVEYKYIKKDGSNNVIWESGANRVLTTGAGGSTLTVNDAWK
jgi:alpha-amylase